MRHAFPPLTRGADVQIFIGAGRDLPASNMDVWHKPHGYSSLWIMCVGAGAGGGAGKAGLAGTARGGGGGGGSSGHMVCHVSMLFVPEYLYIDTFAGGAGGATALGGVDGIGGTTGRIKFSPYESDVILNRFGHTGSAATPGGTGGTSSSAGSGGSAGSAGSVAFSPLLGVGRSQYAAGQAGSNGGSQVGQAGVFIGINTTGCPTQGGSGGAGTTSANFAGGGNDPSVTGLLSEKMSQAATAGSNNGAGGSVIWQPFFLTGGLGGASNNTGAGGKGGPGGPGCGGGGGGGGTTEGVGGDGGPSYAVLIAFP